MTKKDFLNALVAGLSRAMRTEEIAELRDYYAEQIDDRVEDGLSEEEAVAALGDPAALAEKLLRESGVRVAAPKAAGIPTDAEEARVRGRIERVELDIARADVTLRVDDLPEGETARVKFSGKYSWSLADGTLRIEEKDEEKGFLRRLISLPMEVTLDESDLERLDARSLAGDLSLAGLSVSRALMAETRSGDVRLVRAAAPELAIGSASGDISLEDISAPELTAESASGDISAQDVMARAIRLKSASGDMTLQGLTTDALQAGTASGDISLRNAAIKNVELHSSSGDLSVQALQGTELRAETVSGDIDLSSAALSEALEAETASGDIALRGVSAGQLELHSRNGDITGSLREAEGGYRFETHTAHGDVSVPSSEGERLVRAETVGGDIHFRVEV